MPHVLVVHESETVRTELAHELASEGLQVTEAEAASTAIRAVWEGSFDAIVLADDPALEQNLRGIAPEMVMVKIRKEKPSKTARRVVDILNGEAAA